MRRIFLIFYMIMFVSMIRPAAWAGASEKSIGVLMWSEEPRYLATLKGIMDQLGSEGFAEPAVQFTVENARGGKAKLAELAHGFAAAKMNMVISIGTTATIAAAREIGDAPLIFAYVYDPVESGIVLGGKNSGNNVTGASSRVSMSKLMDVLKGFAPVTRLAVLYTPGEKNSEVQLKELQKILVDSPVRVVPVILSRPEEAELTMAGILPAVDAVYLSGSSIIGNTVSTIVIMATKAKVATVTHLDDLAGQGVLLGVCADPYLVGRLAGEKAARVLKGANPTSIPMESLSEYNVILNMKTVKAGGFQVPPSFMKSVTKVIE